MPLKFSFSIFHHSLLGLGIFVFFFNLVFSLYWALGLGFGLGLELGLGPELGLNNLGGLDESGTGREVESTVKLDRPGPGPDRTGSVEHGSYSC